MPETPNNHDDQDDEGFDRLLRDAGARMRVATESAQPPEVRPMGARATPPRWVLPIAIVTASAAAVVAAVWIAGPATETVRDAPAGTGVDTGPDFSVDEVPVVVPIESTPPPETVPAEEPTYTDPIAADPGQPVVGVTVADFDGAGGMCLRFVAEAGGADACLTHRQLEDTATWTVALIDGQAYELAIDPLDAAASSATAIDEVCGHAPSALTQARWLNTSCEPDRYFWFVAAPQVPGGESTTYVVPPRTGEPIALEPIESALPDGFVAYRANYEELGMSYRCLVVASFPDPWREACVHGSDVPRLLVPTAGSVFLVEPAPEVASVVVHDTAAIDVNDSVALSVAIAGCTAPVGKIAAPLDSSVMISGLICAGDSAMITVPAVFLQYGPSDGLGYPLQRAPDGSWSALDRGTSFPCPSDSLTTCEALAVDGDLMFAPLPLAPLSVFGSRLQGLEPVEITVDVRSISVGARSANEIAAAVTAQYDTPESGDVQGPVVAFDDGLGLVVVGITLSVDATSFITYYVWYRPTGEGELRVERAYQITA